MRYVNGMSASLYVNLDKKISHSNFKINIGKYLVILSRKSKKQLKDDSFYLITGSSFY